MKRKFCFLRLCVLILTPLFISGSSANVFKHFSRFSDVLRKGSHWNSESVGGSSPAYDSSRVEPAVDDNEAEASAGNVETAVAAQPEPQIANAHISSGFSPVAFTSRVQLPQQFMRADIPNKESSYSYSYSTTFPTQSRSQNQHQHGPLPPVLLQPIIQYIIQLPSHKQFDHNGNDLEKTVDDEPDGSNSNLSENLIEMMEEASKGEDINSPNANNNAPPVNMVSETDSSINEKIQQETVDNLVSIIEHMNNVSNADVLLSANSSAENDVAMYGSPESSSERPNDNYHQFADSYGGGYSGATANTVQEPRVNNNNPTYYSSPNRKIIRDGFLKSNLRSLQPRPEETEEAVSLFSHLSDQIFRDLNKETFRNEVSNRNADGRSHSRDGRHESSVIGNNPTYSRGRQESASTFDPNYGAYYTSYSNQRPPLDSEIYQTLQTILRNK